MSNSTPRIKNVMITIIEGGEEKQKTVTVMKAGLGKWKQLSDTLQRLINLLPEYLESQGVEDPDEFIENLEPVDLLQMAPKLLMFASEEITKLLQLGTGLEPDFIDEHISLDEALELFQAIGEVNGLMKLSKNFPILQVMAKRAWRNQTGRNGRSAEKKPTESSTN